MNKTIKKIVTNIIIAILVLIIGALLLLFLGWIVYGVMSIWSSIMNVFF